MVEHPHGTSLTPAAITAIAALAAVLAAPGAATSAAKGGTMSMTLASSAFTHQGDIPVRYTCEAQGKEVSPPLSWSGVPAAAKSLALIVDDPDAPDPKAPRMTWVHWVVYDLPPTVSGLPAAVRAGALPAG